MIILFFTFALFEQAYSNLGSFNLDISRETIHLTNETNPQWCNPGETFETECNTCQCITHDSAMCTQHHCRKSKSSKKHRRRQKRKPKATAKNDMNKLEKYEIDELEKNAKLCFAKPKGTECEDHTAWTAVCNICFCVNGYLACTKRSCKNYTHISHRMLVAKGKYGTDWFMMPGENGEMYFISLSKEIKKLRQRDTVHHLHTRRNNASRRHRSRLNRLYNQRRYPMLPKDGCRPGTFYKVNCKLCFCNDQKEVICAPKECDITNILHGNRVAATPEDIISLLDTKEFLYLPKLLRQTDACDPGKVYSVDCNTCICLSTGTLLCDTLPCIDYDKLNVWRALDLTGKPCKEDEDSPNSKCVTCVCVKGLSKCEPLGDCIENTMRNIHGDYEKYPKNKFLNHLNRKTKKKKPKITSKTNMNKLVKYEVDQLEKHGKLYFAKPKGTECTDDTAWSVDCNICFCINGYSACTKRSCKNFTNDTHIPHKLLDAKGIYGKDWILMPGDDSDLYYVSLSKNTDPKIKEEKIYYHLYTRKNSNNPEEIKMNFKKRHNFFLPKEMLKIIIHGFVSNGKATWIIDMKNAYLNRSNHNVMVVDWQNLASILTYLNAPANTLKVGEELGSLIIQIIRFYKINPNAVHMIGHSLGAHVAGFAGKYIRKNRFTIDRITGLDPASPLFKSNTGIDSGGAAFVDVIHTNTNFLGLEKPLGHADFYPNGGSIQEGCKSIIPYRSDCCSHTRPSLYFTESILRGGFLSYKCTNYDLYIKGKCKKSATNMGEYCAKSARGKYFLQTNKKSPFSKN